MELFTAAELPIKNNFLSSLHVFIVMLKFVPSPNINMVIKSRRWTGHLVCTERWETHAEF